MNLLEAIPPNTGVIQAVGPNSDIYLNILPLITGSKVVAELNGKLVTETGELTTCAISRPVVVVIDGPDSVGVCESATVKVVRDGEKWVRLDLTRRDIGEPLRVLHSRGIRFF